MKNPDDIDLIIFDTDGTIVPSLEIVYEAIKRAFGKLGWEVTFQPEDINRFFGLPSATASGGGLYDYITPPHSHLTPDELRDKVRDEYSDAFKDMGRTFPGVRETLATLRERGYRLALYSNASPRYFNAVTGALDILDCFDYAECVMENDLTKPTLIQKIKEMFGSTTAAVVGDRVHDIDAAAETGSLSVGILFGYGGAEPKQADFTIDSFDRLLDIFDRRRPVFDKIAGEIDRRKQKNKPYIVGVSGIDGSGKTVFTRELADFLVSRGTPVQVINLDDFHNSREVRYAGDDPADSYFHRSFDLKALVDSLLAPIREKGGHRVTMKHLDVETDEYTVGKEYRITPDTIVLFEGVFLFRDELAPYIDHKIFLDIPFAESKRRAEARDSAEIIGKYDVKYLPAQGKYLEKYPPRDTADMIIDNSNYEHPVIVFLS